MKRDLEVSFLQVQLREDLRSCHVEDDISDPGERKAFRNDVLVQPSQIGSNPDSSPFIRHRDHRMGPVRGVNWFPYSLLVQDGDLFLYFRFEGQGNRSEADCNWMDFRLQGDPVRGS